MNTKAFLKRIRRNFYEFMGNSKYSCPGLFDLDKKLQKYLNYKNGFFIEVGANDGYNQSNTYYLEKILGWKGILVEPIPELFKECQKNRVTVQGGTKSGNLRRYGRKAATGDLGN